MKKQPDSPTASELSLREKKWRNKPFSLHKIISQAKSYDRG